MTDREQLYQINKRQLVTRTDRLLFVGVGRSPLARPVAITAPVTPRPARATTPWRAVIFGAMFGVVAGAIAIAELSRLHPHAGAPVVAHTRR